MDVIKVEAGGKMPVPKMLTFEEKEEEKKEKKCCSCGQKKKEEEKQCCSCCQKKEEKVEEKKQCCGCCQKKEEKVEEKKQCCGRCQKKEQEANKEETTEVEKAQEQKKSCWTCTKSSKSTKKSSEDPLKEQLLPEESQQDCQTLIDSGIISSSSMTEASFLALSKIKTPVCTPREDHMDMITEENEEEKKKKSCWDCLFCKQDKKEEAVKEEKKEEENVVDAEESHGLVIDEEEGAAAEENETTQEDRELSEEENGNEAAEEPPTEEKQEEETTKAESSPQEKKTNSCLDCLLCRCKRRDSPQSTQESIESQNEENLSLYINEEEQKSPSSPLYSNPQTPNSMMVAKDQFKDIKNHHCCHCCYRTKQDQIDRDNQIEKCCCDCSTLGINNIAKYQHHYTTYCCDRSHIYDLHNQGKVYVRYKNYTLSQSLQNELTLMEDGIFHFCHR